MRISDSAIVRAPLGLVQAGGGWRSVAFPVRFGLIEANGRRCLVDTGYGPRVTRGARSPALRVYAALLRPRLVSLPSLSADTVLLTHLHADHVARLRDWPDAHLLAASEAIETFHIMTPRQATRHGIFAELLPDDFATRVRAVESLPRVATGTVLGDGFDLCADASHLVVPLPGHAPGHLGVFWRDGNQATLYATDVAWTLAGLHEDSTPTLARAAVFHDRVAARRTEERVRAFAAGGGRVILCHDPGEVPG